MLLRDAFDRMKKEVLVVYRLCTAYICGPSIWLHWIFMQVFPKFWKRDLLMVCVWLITMWRLHWNNKRCECWVCQIEHNNSIWSSLQFKASTTFNEIIHWLNSSILSPKKCFYQCFFVYRWKVSSKMNLESIISEHNSFFSQYSN